MKFDKILKLELKEYEIKLLLIVINKEITILNNTDLEINKKELFDLIKISNYLIVQSEKNNINWRM
jgi:hypothetical protein|tara:strand:+ start:262 stop:459 length:198 start_codon:yes stop_codon:yes gene_type:complete